MLRATYISLLIGCATIAKGQNGLSTLSLGEIVPQNTHQNAAYQAPGKVVIGLPILSEMGIHVNNRFSYNQAITRSEDDSVRLDVDKLMSNLKNKNVLLAESRVPIAFVSFQPESVPFGFSFFINDRMSAGIQYQQALASAVWNGTNSLVSEPLSLKKTAMAATYQREYGIGANTWLIEDELKIGARLKVIQGIANIKTLAGLDAAIELDGLTYSYLFDLERVGVNTAGMDNITSPGYLLSNKNRGVAIDAGATWKFNDLLSFSAAINDLGFVHWKQNSENFIIRDSSFVFNGVNLSAGGDITSTVDSLTNALTPRRSSNPYSAMLSTRVIIGGSLSLNATDQVSVTIMNQLLVGKIKSAYSLAFTRQLTAGIRASGTLVKLPQHWPRPGAAVSFTGGAMQYYVGSDNLLGFTSMPNVNTFDVKMGVNVLLGHQKPKGEQNLPPAHRSKAKFSTKGGGVDYPTDPRLRKPKVFRKIKIYDIIEKPKKPKGWKNWFKNKPNG